MGTAVALFSLLPLSFTHPFTHWAGNQVALGSGGFWEMREMISQFGKVHQIEFSPNGAHVGIFLEELVFS